jgi:hypothetical protein
MRKWLVIFATILLVFGATKKAPAVLVDFNVPDPPTGPITINNYYAPLGVVFNDLVGASEIYNNPGSECDYLAGTCSFWTGNELTYIIEAKFSFNVSTVSIDAWTHWDDVFGPIPDPVDHSYMSAYDSSYNLVETIKDSSYGVWETISITSLSNDIRYLHLSATYTEGYRQVHGRFDNLNFTPVPEPSTLLLLGSGFVGLGLVRRRFKG